MSTIGHALMKALRKGVRRCSDDALECLRGFVAAQWHESGGFCDRAGKPDIYYTQFGLMLARALGMKIDASAVGKFCWKHDVSSFDLVHANCFVRSLLLARPWFAWLQGRRIRRDCPFAALVVEAHTPYEQFLALTLAQDAGLPFWGKHWRKCWGKFEKKSLEVYRSADGLYANVPEAAEGGVNATASAILAEVFAGTRDLALSAAHALAKQERDDGSFCANPSTPFPDILSTASAHFALHTVGIRPRNDAKFFVEECFVEDVGGFAASPEGGTPDLEYTVYGVILMGLA